MLVVGQWILLGMAVVLGVVVLCKAAGYLLKFIFVMAMAAIAIYGLYHFSLLPEPAQKYISDFLSKDPVQRVRAWFHQQCDGDEVEEAPQDQPPVNS